MRRSSLFWLAGVYHWGMGTRVTSMHRIALEGIVSTWLSGLN